MLHLSAKRHRFIVWWEDALWKTFWATIVRTYYSICFIGWVSPYNCEGSVKNPPIWKESLTWNIPRIRSVCGVNLEGWHTGCGHWGVGDDGRIWNLLEKTQCERGDVSQRKRIIYFSNSRWTNQNPLEKIRNWEHPPCYGRDQVEERVILTFLKNQKGLFHNLKTHFRMPVKRWTIFGPCQKLQLPPSRWTKSPTLLAERRIIPYSTEIHWRNQNYSYEFGCQARETHWWLLEHWWLSRLVGSLDRFHTIYPIRRKSSRRIYVVWGEIDQKTAYIQARSSMARALEINGKEMLSWRRSKSGHMKNLNSTMHENYEEFISLTLRTRNSRRPSRMLARNWKHQCLLPCLARSARTIRIVGVVVNPVSSNQNLRVFWKPVNPQDCVWETHYRITMKTKLQEKETIHCSITIWFTNVFLCFKPCKCPQ